MMRFLGKYWKVLIAILLVALSVYLYMEVYEKEKLAHETQVQQINTMITALQKTIAENQLYADVQEDIPAALEAVQQSRLKLYEHFPVDMKEEDQIMHVLYLESVFGTEIMFNFNTAVALGQLRDGSYLLGLPMTINYDTTYKGFKDMVDYLATDSRITSVHYANIEYDAETDTVKGLVTLRLYLIATNLRGYESPIIPDTETGKENIYD